MPTNAKPFSLKISTKCNKLFIADLDKVHIDFWKYLDEQINLKNIWSLLFYTYKNIFGTYVNYYKKNFTYLITNA